MQGDLSIGISWAAALGLAACSAGGGGSKNAAEAGPLGTPLIGLGESLKASGGCQAPTAATPPIRRISRIEYDNAVAQLFGATGGPADGFVPEEKTGVTIGFNTNVGSAVSELAVEQYVSAAEQIAEGVAQGLTPVTGCQAASDTACIQAFLVSRARRAFRGTLPDDEKAQLLADYQAAALDLGPDQALRFGIEAILLSPRFLYSVEIGAGAGAVVPLTGSEMAGRLAASLWRSVPDDALLALADQGGLDTAAGVTAAARQMLADPRAKDMLADFARQWLDVESTPSLTRDNTVWPDFTRQLARDLLTETEQLFLSVATSKGTFPDLLTADHTMANAAVAQFYGLPAPAGSGFQEVTLPKGRLGVLTHGSVIASHSHFNRPSIVLRGKLVRFQLLCDPVSPPPPSVNTTLAPLPTGTTERDLAEAHAHVDFCNGCHKMMDPIGYGFGAFDAVGKLDPASKEDTTGTIAPPALAAEDDVSGGFAGVGGLAHRLAQSQDVQQCYVVQAMRYALGRREAEADACSAAAAWDHFVSTGLALEEVIVAIAASDTFRYRTAVKAGEACQ